MSPWLVALAAADIAALTALVTLDVCRWRRARAARREEEARIERLRQADIVTLTAAEILIDTARRRLSETRHPSNEYPLTDG